MSLCVPWHGPHKDKLGPRIRTSHWSNDDRGRPRASLLPTYSYLGLSLDDPASKEEPVRATRTGRQLVAHFATLLFTLSLQGMRMEQARTRADVAGDRGLSPVRSQAFRIGVSLQVMRMGARPPADVAV